MYLTGRSYSQPANIAAAGMFGLYIRHRRHGRHRIVPNIHTDQIMYSLIFNHDEVEIEVDGELRQLPPHTLTLWDNSHLVYYGAPQATWHISWLQLFPPTIEPLLQEYKIPLNVSASWDDERLIDRYFLPIIEEFSEYTELDAELIDNAVRGLLLQFRREFRQNNRKRQLIPPVFRHLQEYIEENFRRKLTLEELSAMAGLNPSYLSRRFKAYFGQAPIDYAVALRLDEAMYYLKNSTMNVQEISTQAGYDDFYHFSKLFKRHCGCSPKNFRRMQQEDSVTTAEKPSFFSSEV